jgi:hypothetical protein
MRSQIILVLSIALTTVFVGCGALSNLSKMASEDAKNQIKKDMVDHPYLARRFKADRPRLQKALEDVFNASGYPVGYKREGEVRAQPTSVSEANSGDYSLSNRAGKVYWLEMMSGWVSDLDGQNVVYLQFQRGSSMARDQWRGETGGSLGSGGKSVGSDIKTDYDKKYYKDIMNSIARAVGE